MCIYCHARKEVGEGRRGEGHRQNGPEKGNRLYHVLLDDGITFSEGLRRQIDVYLEEKEPREKQRKERRPDDLLIADFIRHSA